MKYVYIDFEYNQTSEKYLNLVCCSFFVESERMPLSFWLLSDKTETLVRCLLELKDTHTFVSYSVEAEARAFIALGLNPLDFKWLDLYIEYRMLTNHSRISYGKHLIDGKIKYLKNVNEAMEDDNISYYDAKDAIKEQGLSGKIEHNLAACCYKLLGVMIDTVEKDTVRDIIIKGNQENILANKERITTYCESDVKYLPEILSKMQSYPNSGINTAGLRAEYAARTAIMVTEGYPIKTEALAFFTSNIPKIMEECRIDVNNILSSQGIPKPFSQDKKGEWHFAKKVIQDYIQANLDTKTWDRTNSGTISLSGDALEGQGASRHEYKHTLVDQLARWASLEASMRGFKDPTKGSKKRLTDYLGSDGRVRPYFGIFGAQSSRSQQTATSFIFLKSAWIRILVQPPKGKVIIGCDYSSQEFLLSALISKDMAMKKAYLSGDVYLNFACTTGMIAEKMPIYGTKEYKKFKEKCDNERSTCKSLVLGLSYMMGKLHLAAKLTAESKINKVYTEDEAADLRQTFRDTYPDFIEWQENLIKDYKEYKEPIILPCGWRMFGQNPNFRSVGNVPMQGAGASIMRKAVALCQDIGLKVIMTLHDCVYIECDLEDLAKNEVLLQQKMTEAFDFYFPNSGIKADVKHWGYGTNNTYHIDKRGEKEWIKYSQYVMPEWASEGWNEL